jgi:hypothetical protein
MNRYRRVHTIVGIDSLHGRTDLVADFDHLASILSTPGNMPPGADNDEKVAVGQSCKAACGQPCRSATLQPCYFHFRQHACRHR